MSQSVHFIHFVQCVSVAILNYRVCCWKSGERFGSRQTFRLAILSACRLTVLSALWLAVVLTVGLAVGLAAVVKTMAGMSK